MCGIRLLLIHFYCTIKCVWNQHQKLTVSEIWALVSFCELCSARLLQTFSLETTGTDVKLDIRWCLELLDLGCWICLAMAQQLKIDITVCAMSSDAENIVDISCWERFVQKFFGYWLDCIFMYIDEKIWIIFECMFVQTLWSHKEDWERPSSASTLNPIKGLEFWIAGKFLKCLRVCLGSCWLVNARVGCTSWHAVQLPHSFRAEGMLTASHCGCHAPFHLCR